MGEKLALCSHHFWDFLMGEILALHTHHSKGGFFAGRNTRALLPSPSKEDFCNGRKPRASVPSLFGGIFRWEITSRFIPIAVWRDFSMGENLALQPHHCLEEFFDGRRPRASLPSLFGMNYWWVKNSRFTPIAIWRDFWMGKNLEFFSHHFWGGFFRWD